MKICEECGTEFVPKGRQKVCKGCKDGIQKELPEQKETRPQRPLERFRTNAVMPGCVGFKRVIR